MDLLWAINDTAFSAWVRESSSVFAYPMFLLLHTVGLAVVVGLSSILALLILGSAPASVLSATRPVFPYLWAGFGLNAASGLVLVMADAPTMVMNPIMWIKFVFIAGAILIMRRVQRLVRRSTAPSFAGAATGRGMLLAAATLLCWVGAIVTGRLTAYIGPVAGLMGE